MPCVPSHNAGGRPARPRALPEEDDVFTREARRAHVGALQQAHRAVAAVMGFTHGRHGNSREVRDLDLVGQELHHAIVNEDVTVTVYSVLAAHPLATVAIHASRCDLLALPLWLADDAAEILKNWSE
jgi:hypothetical protein